MKASTIHSILFVSSLVFNVLCIVFFVLALSGESANIKCYNMDEKSFTAAALVNTEEGTEVVFNAIALTMKRGAKAAVQFSLSSAKEQSNFIINGLYDRSIISVTPTSFGILITALTNLFISNTSYIL
ncbi:MAG: hypothetical protein Ta2G_13520 [Termitinemataceae bacterium]|nr:MAG: hypothetical protein Ta2G_13520 [Termitinemataceae bacterium]